MGFFPGYRAKLNPMDLGLAWSGSFVLRRNGTLSLVWLSCYISSNQVLALQSFCQVFSPSNNLDSLISDYMCSILTHTCKLLPLSRSRKDGRSTLQVRRQRPVCVQPVQHWLYLPVEAGQGKGRGRPLWTVHVIQPEKGFKSRAHQSAERCICQSAATGAGNRAAHLSADVLVSLP